MGQCCEIFQQSNSSPVKRRNITASIRARVITMEKRPKVSIRERVNMVDLEVALTRGKDRVKGARDTIGNNNNREERAD